jgi:phosphate uptake regulator
MVLEFFRRGGHTTLEEVEQSLVDMVHRVRDVYDAAMEAVFGGGKSKDTKRTVKSTDRSINEEQRQVRRALMLHAAVETVDLPQVLGYMSVVKDAERAGDYAKNLYDLAKYGANFEEADDRAELEHYRDAVGGLIDEVAEVFAHRDTDRAAALIEKADGFLDEYDDHVRAAYDSPGPASDAVARALYYRYLKRLTAHLMNVLTSLVMPIDRLDYYDEAKDDREGS